MKPEIAIKWKVTKDTKKPKQHYMKNTLTFLGWTLPYFALKTVVPI